MYYVTYPIGTCGPQFWAYRIVSLYGLFIIDLSAERTLRKDRDLVYTVHDVCHTAGPGSMSVERTAIWAISKAGFSPARQSLRGQPGTSAFTNSPQKSSISFLYKGERHILDFFFFLAVPLTVNNRKRRPFPFTLQISQTTIHSHHYFYFYIIVTMRPAADGSYLLLYNKFGFINCFDNYILLYLFCFVNPPLFFVSAGIARWAEGFVV